MNNTAKIFVAGHRGLVGSAIVRRLQRSGYSNLVLRTSKELDLRDQAATSAFFATEKPEYVFLAAAKVGGILANSTYPADFIMDNIAIETNVIRCCYQAGVKKLLFLGSSCIYPRECPQPIKEEYLLTGPLEKTNDAYAVAKIAGIKMCEAYNTQYGTDYISVMPTNLYGPGDNYDLTNSHVLPALIRKVYEAKQRGDNEIVVWGTGAPLREFLHSDDLADACIFLMERHGAKDIGSVINIGTGKDLSIRELAEMIVEIAEYKGKLVFDTTKPDGTPRKLLNVSRLHQLGWQESIPLEQGLKGTFEDYCLSVESERIGIKV